MLCTSPLASQKKRDDIRNSMDSPGPLDTLDPNIPSRQPNGKFQAPHEPTKGTVATAGSLSHVTKPSLTGMPPFQRPRKRVVWRNKACFIALPPEDEFGRKTARASYLGSDDFEKRLEEWKIRGFDTRGFILAPQTSDLHSPCSEGQSRFVYPDLEDEKRERGIGNYRVQIPDRQNWVCAPSVPSPVPERFFSCKTCSESEEVFVSSRHLVVRTLPEEILTSKRL